MACNRLFHAVSDLIPLQARYFFGIGRINDLEITQVIGGDAGQCLARVQRTDLGERKKGDRVV